MRLNLRFGAWENEKLANAMQKRQVIKYFNLITTGMNHIPGKDSRNTMPQMPGKAN
jgi:hypothetical protein